MINIFHEIIFRNVIIYYNELLSVILSRQELYLLIVLFINYMCIHYILTLTF